MIRTAEDVVNFVKEHRGTEISITDYSKNTIWCRILKGHHCIDHEKDGIIGVELPDLYRYVWRNRKAINRAIKGEIDMNVKAIG